MRKAFISAVAALALAITACASTVATEEAVGGSVMDLSRAKLAGAYTLRHHNYGRLCDVWQISDGGISHPVSRRYYSCTAGRALRTTILRCWAAWQMRPAARL